MKRWHDEWQRLYAVPGASDTRSASPGMIDAQGRVRALVLAWGRPADWPTLAALWRGVQAELGWPAPAIAVDGHDAFQLWFSLVEPVPADEARRGLQALAARFLPAAREGERLRLWPLLAEGRWQHAPDVPAPQDGGRRWSAFVAPDLAAVFNDEASLDLEPGQEAQAERLAPLRSVPPDRWHSLGTGVAGLQASETQTVAPAPTGATPCPPITASPHLTFEDPRDFLRAVMNDANAPLALRVDAAKALLGRG